MLWKWICCRSFPVCKKGKRKILLGLSPVGAKAVFSIFFPPASKAEVVQKTPLGGGSQISGYTGLAALVWNWELAVIDQMGPPSLPVGGWAAQRVPGCAGFWVWGQLVALPSGCGYGLSGESRGAEITLSGAVSELQTFGAYLRAPKIWVSDMELGLEVLKVCWCSRNRKWDFLPRDGGSAGTVGLLWGGGPWKHMGFRWVTW